MVRRVAARGGAGRTACSRYPRARRSGRCDTLLAFCLFQGSSDQTLPRPLQALRDLAAANVLAAPAVDAATGEYAGWISVGSLLQQILRGMYPALLDPEFVSQAG